MRRHVTTLRDILAEGVDAGQFRAGLDLTPTAFAILTMCDVVIVWYRPEGRLALLQREDVDYRTSADDPELDVLAEVVDAGVRERLDVVALQQRFLGVGPVLTALSSCRGQARCRLGVVCAVVDVGRVGALLRRG